MKNLDISLDYIAFYLCENLDISSNDNAFYLFENLDILMILFVYLFLNVPGQYQLCWAACKRCVNNYPCPRGYHEDKGGYCKPQIPG